jgi:hypothetical protein
MYADCLDTTHRFPFAPSFEAGWLFCAGSLAVAALIVLLLPHDAVTWAIAHFG